MDRVKIVYRPRRRSPSKWEVYFKAGKQRIPKFFKGPPPPADPPEDAVDYQKRKEKDLERYGSQFQYPARLRMKIDQALILCEEAGVDIVEAVQRGIANTQGKPIEPYPLKMAIELFLDEKTASGLRPTTLQSYTQRLRFFATSFPDRTVDSFTWQEIETWLKRLPTTRTTNMVTFRNLKVFFRWAYRYEPPFIAKDIFEGKDPPFPKEEHKEIEFLSVDQVQKLLDAADPGFLPCLALQLFAGIRVEEAQRMQWSNIQFGDKLIRVPAEASKTRRVRVIQSPFPNIWPWLKLYRSEGSILQVRYRDHRLEAMEAAEIKTWPRNACRHTFATHHVAAYRAPGKTALVLGHTGDLRLLENHYKGLVSQAEGKRYAKILPEEN